MMVGVGLLLVVGVHRMAPALFFVFFLLPLLIHSAEEGGIYFPDCPGMSCGNRGPLYFPFTNATRPECGLIKVSDCNKSTQKIQFQGGGRWYDMSVSLLGTAVIHDQELKKQLKSSSCDALNSLTLPISPFWYFRNITMYKCNRSLSVPLSTDFNYTNCNHVFHYNHIGNHLPSLPSQCSIIQLPVEPTGPINAEPFSFLTADISLDLLPLYDCLGCKNGKGQCRFYHNGTFQCVKAKTDCVGCKEVRGQCGFYHNGTFQCVKAKTGSKRMVIRLALGIGGPIFIFCLLFCILQGHCKQGGNSSSNKSKFFWNKENQNHQTVEVFLRENQWLAPKRYSYSDIKKMTRSFKDKLGQGGYGGVYKGKLSDGRLVAVKVLNKSKGDGEEFVNEVASISRTSHVNIVTLLGFCFQGSKRALIYEFMPNGSLEKFIYDKKETSHLGWEVLYQIAIGIARGLEYLHRGCSTRILHFDIKPHNILLDKNFVPKVSDFGLAKLCPEKGSIVSMMGARGTVGYIAPEVFCRNIGGVSHKSDVYSYGMMILEMVGGRKNSDVGVDHTSEIYFPHWIYRQIEQGEELGLERVKNDEENEKANKMILVGLWCIQTDPSIRPPMARVVEMLQGSLELLQIPPKPFLCSPPRPVVDSSTSLSPAIMTS